WFVSQVAVIGESVDKPKLGGPEGLGDRLRCNQPHGGVRGGLEVAEASSAAVIPRSVSRRPTALRDDECLPMHLAARRASYLQSRVGHRRLGLSGIQGRSRYANGRQNTAFPTTSSSPSRRLSLRGSPAQTHGRGHREPCVGPSSTTPRS